MIQIPISRCFTPRSAKVLGLSSLVLTSVLASASADAAWVTTGTKSMTPYLSGAVAGAALPDSTSVHVLVGLKIPNAADLESFTVALATPGNPAYGQIMTDAQFEAAYAPSPASAQSVANYLTSAGLVNVTVAADRLYVTAEGSPSVVEKAFNTTLSTFTYGGKTVFANISDAQVPDNLSDLVLSVVGLNNIAPMHTSIKHRNIKKAEAAKSVSSVTANKVTPDAGSPSLLMEYTPVQFQTAYDVASTPAATNTVIAIFAEGDLTQVLLDLRTAESMNGLPQQPYTVVQIGAQSGDTSGADEFDLDTQTSSGFASEVKNLVIYDTTSLNDVDLIPSFNQFVLDDDAEAGSASFGGCELTEMTSGAIPVYDQIFHKAFVQGQTVFASSGDNGGACAELASTGVPDTGVVTGQDYPCSSTYVTCVGGTTLTTDAQDNYIMEISWDSGGGGTSEVEPPEFWQDGIVPTSSVAVPEVGDVTLYKGIPDVAMDADNQLSPASIIVDGAAEGVGGTSLASPLALGAWARMESAHCNSLGNASPILYKFAVGLDATTGTLPSVGGGFHDIILGTNGLYTALPGWDYTTGLGSFDITAVNAALPTVTCVAFGSNAAPGTGGTSSGSSSGSTGTTTTSSSSSSSGSSSTGTTATGGASSGAFGLNSAALFGLVALLRRRRRVQH